MTETSFEEILKSGQKLVYTNVGDSMMPLIRQGRDLLIIEKNHEKWKKYDVPLYKRENGQYILHRILAIHDDGYVLCGDNQCRKETGVREEQLLGILTGIIRDGKKLSVKDWRYQLYVHLWCAPFRLRTFIIRGRRRILRLFSRFKAVN